MSAAPALDRKACQPAARNSPWVGRTAAAAHDLEFPEVQFPSPDLLLQAGEDALRDLVRHHHRLLRGSAIGGLLSSDPLRFDAMVERIADFVVESCGGPPRYTEQAGEGCMRSRHFAFTIDEAGRETWLFELARALDTSRLPPAAREAYWDWAEPLSIRMVNRRTEKAQPRRYPFSWVLARVRHPALAGCRR